MNLVLLEADEIGGDGLVRLKGRRATHLLKVLNAKAGDTFRAGAVMGPRGQIEVMEVSDNALTICWTPGDDKPVTPGIDLLLAMPRPKVMNRLWAPLASLGLRTIVLVNAEKVERYYFDSHVIEEATYRPRLLEGMEQAQHTRLPEVRIQRRFKPFIEDDADGVFDDALRVLAHPSLQTTLPQILEESPSQRVVLAVGPEGGWSNFELGLLKEHGFLEGSLGPATLRTDVACVALLSVVKACMPTVKARL